MIIKGIYDILPLIRSQPKLLTKTHQKELLQILINEQDEFLIKFINFGLNDRCGFVKME